MVKDGHVFWKFIQQMAFKLLNFLYMLSTLRAKKMNSCSLSHCQKLCSALKSIISKWSEGASGLEPSPGRFHIHDLKQNNNPEILTARDTDQSKKRFKYGFGFSICRYQNGPRHWLSKYFHFISRHYHSYVNESRPIQR